MRSCCRRSVFIQPSLVRIVLIAGDRRRAEVRDYPSKASLLKDIYRPLPICPAVDPANTDPAAVFAACLTTLSAGLTSGDLEGIKRCFHSDQSYWRDQLAFTYHSRTFSDASIPMSLYKRSKIAGPTAFTPLPGARVTPAGPTLTWIDGFFYFETTSGMKAECAGMAQLIQDKEDGKWKIWTLSTWIKDLKDFPEEEALLSAPAKPVEGNKVETGVLVIGAGNALVPRQTAIQFPLIMPPQRTGSFGPPEGSRRLLHRHRQSRKDR